MCAQFCQACCLGAMSSQRLNVIIDVICSLYTDLHFLDTKCQYLYFYCSRVMTLGFYTQDTLTCHGWENIRGINNHIKDGWMTFGCFGFKFLGPRFDLILEDLLLIPKIKISVICSSACWTSGDVLWSTVNFWSFTSKQFCSILLNNWSGWGIVLKLSKKTQKMAPSGVIQVSGSHKTPPLI